MRRLPEGWEWRRVSEVGDVQIGRQRSPHQMTGPYMRPYLRVANVLDGCIDYSDVLEMNFTPSEFEVFSLRPGDILLNEGQSLELVGRSAIYAGSPGLCFQNTLIRFRPLGADGRFARAVFKYWLDNGEFVKIAKQTTSIAHLGGSRFASMMFPTPPIEEQRRIADILDAAEALHAVTRRTFSKLRARRSGLLYDLIHNYSGATSRVANLANVSVGHVGPTEAFYTDASRGIPFLRTGNITSKGLSLHNLRYVTEEFHLANGKSELRMGDVVVSRVGYTGTAAIVPELGKANCANMIIIRPTEEISPEYLKLLFQSDLVIGQVQGFTAGSAQPVLNIRLVERIEVPVPPKEEQIRVNSILELVDQEALRYEAMVQKLQKLKEGLMGGLLTGRVRVMDAESVLEDL